MRICVAQHSMDVVEQASEPSRLVNEATANGTQARIFRCVRASGCRDCGSTVVLVLRDDVVQKFVENSVRRLAALFELDHFEEARIVNNEDQLIFVT